jgi:hypothetical protein
LVRQIDPSHPAAIQARITSEPSDTERLYDEAMA